MVEKWRWMWSGVGSANSFYHFCLNERKPSEGIVGHCGGAVAGQVEAAKARADGGEARDHDARQARTPRQLETRLV